MVLLPLRTQFCNFRFLGARVQRLIGFDRFQRLFNTATQHNVGATACHIRRNGDHLGTTRLRHDVGFPRVLLGVENLVWQLFFLQQRSDDFRVFDGRSPHQHRLSALMALANILDGRFVLLARGLVHAVQLVFTAADAVGWYHHRFQTVDFLEFVGLGIRRTRHTSELAVQAEIILEGNRCESLVLSLNVHAFLSFHGLVQAIAPAATGHQTAGELVHDHDLALLHHIVLVTVVEMVGTQGCVQMVHQRDIGGVVQRRSFWNQPHLGKYALCTFMTLLGQEYLVALFVQGEVTRLGHALAGDGISFSLLAHQTGDGLVNGQVHGGVVFGLTTDDQRRARFIDQNRVHLVHDGKIQTTLYAVSHFIDHVVAQVVKTVFVIGAVGNVGTVGCLLFLAGCLGHIDAYRQSQEVVEAPHPLRIAICQVIIDGNHMHTLTSKGIQVHRQGSSKRLTFAGTHFGDLAVMQRHAAQKLHIEVAHLHHALGALAHHGKSFWQHIVNGLAFSQAFFELLRLGP